MSNYLMKGAAALLIGMAVTACSHDIDVDVSDRKAAIDNAQASFGFYIPGNQDWVMSSIGTTNITVNGDYNATYEVFVYQDNPFINNEGTVLAHGTVRSGQTLNMEFRYPASQVLVYAAIRDEKGYYYVKPAIISDGKVETSFGGSTNAARTRGITRGSAADDFVIPTYTQPDFSAYINDATPISAANNTTNPSNTVRHYVIPAGTTWNDNIPLIQASDPNSKDIVSVYVLGTLNINEEQRINGGYGGAYKFIVGNGGVVNIAKGATLRSQANQGSGNVGEIHILAGGTIQGDGKLEFSNGTNAYNYNAGTIDVGTLNNNGGTLYNVGTVQADILEGGAGLSVYINNGKVHIGKSVKGSNSANTRILNNCWWEVDEELYCRNIVQGAGAYIKADDLGMSGSEDGTGDASYIYAKDNSLIEITNYVAFNGVDIVGPTGDNYAYLQFGEATGISKEGHPEWSSNELDIAMNLEGNNTGTYQHPIINNIRMSVDRPVVQDDMYSQTAYQVLLNALNGTRSCTYALDRYNAESDHPEWATMTKWTQQGNGNAVLVKKNEYTAAIVEESECSPGITVNPPTPITNNNTIWSYAFEDSNLKSDYDMNDVVIKVQESQDGNSLYVTLVAAGCEYDNAVYLSESETCDPTRDHLVFTEVHDEFGADHGTMVNTGWKTGVTANPVKKTIAKPSGYDPQTANWYIVPSGGDMAGKPITIARELGINPCGIVIPYDWAWPTERTNICIAYEDFATWAAEEDIATRKDISDWYKRPTAATRNRSYVMK